MARTEQPQESLTSTGLAGYLSANLLRAAMGAADPWNRPMLTPLITSEQIQAKIDEIAEQIRLDYGEQELILVGVLKGSTFFLADLAMRLGDKVKLDFCQVSSYNGGKSSTGVVQIRKDLDNNIEGRNVLLVEDIVDTGLTLSHLKQLFGVRHPQSLKVVSLLSKPEARTHEALIDYVGFEIANEFVVGYGLDYKERYRNLPYIAILQEPA